MSNDNFDFAPDIYTLVDDDGIEQSFELLDVMEIDDQRYFALIPYFENEADAVEADGELVVLKSEVIEGEEMMATIDDDAEYEKVGNIFLEKLSSMYEDSLTDIEELLNGNDDLLQ